MLYGRKIMSRIMKYKSFVAAYTEAGNKNDIPTMNDMMQTLNLNYGDNDGLALTQLLENGLPYGAKVSYIFGDAELSQEGLSFDELALRLHERRHELPARKDGRRPGLDGPVRRHRRRRREAGVPRRRPPRHAPGGHDVEHGHAPQLRGQARRRDRRRRVPRARGQGLPVGHVARAPRDARHRLRVAGALRRRPHVRRHRAIEAVARLAHGADRARARARAVRGRARLGGAESGGQVLPHAPRRGRVYRRADALRGPRALHQRLS